MTQAINIVAETRADVARVLALIEEAQAIAAARTQEIAALGGGATATAGYDWSGSDITESDLFNALSSLSSALPTILGAHATNLYKVTP